MKGDRGLFDALFQHFNGQGKPRRT